MSMILFRTDPSVSGNPFALIPTREKQDSKSWKEAFVLPQKFRNDKLHDICTCTNPWFYKPAFHIYMSFLPVKVSNLFYISI